MQNAVIVVPPGPLRDLVMDLTGDLIGQLAPEEAPLLPETAAEFFDNPERTLTPSRGDEAIGFGLDIALWTPYVMAAAVAVVRFLAASVTQAVGDETSAATSRYIRRIFGRSADANSRSGGPDGELEEPEGLASGLSVELVQRIREIALDRAKGAGLEPTRAGLLADAIAGAVVVRT